MLQRSHKDNLVVKVDFCFIAVELGNFERTGQALLAKLTKNIFILELTKLLSRQVLSHGSIDDTHFLKRNRRNVEHRICHFGHLQNLLLDLWQRRRMSFILVTHNVAEAVFLGRYIMVMGQSPASKRLWLENPCFGNASCRNSDEYFSLIRQVRGALEENSRERLREARS